MNADVTAGLSAQSEQLEKEVQEVDPAMAGHLADVRARLAAGQIEQVAHLNFATLLDADSLEQRASLAYQRAPSWLSWMEWARNVLVLVPIALTWYALSTAAVAYQQAIARNADLITQPFLLMWEQGFPGLSNGPRLTFSQLAAWDMRILLVVIVLTIAVHWWKDVLRDRSERLAATLRERFESYLWMLDDGLAEERCRQQVQAAGRMGESVGAFQEHVASFLGGIQQQQGLLGDLVERRSVELGDLGLFNTGLREGTDRLVQYATALKPVYDQLNGAATELSGQVQQLSQREAELLKALFTISAHSDRLTQAASTFGSSLKAAVDDLQRASREQDSKALTLTGAATELRNVASVLVETENSLRQGLQESQESNRQIAATLQEVSAKMVDSNAGVAKTADELCQMVASLVALSSAGQRQADLEQTLSESMQQVSTYSGQLVTVVTGLSKENQRLNDLMSRVEQQWSWLINGIRVAQPASSGGGVGRALPWIAVGLALLSNITLGLFLLQGALK